MDRFSQSFAAHFSMTTEGMMLCFGAPTFEQSTWGEIGEIASLRLSTNREVTW